MHYINKVIYHKQITCQSAFVVDHVQIFLTPSLITMQNLVAVSHTVYAHADVPNILEDAVALPILVAGLPLSPLETHSCPCVNTSTIVTLGQTILTYAGSQKTWGCWGPAPMGGHVADPLEICFLPTCYHAKFSHSESNRSSIIMEIC